MPAELSQYSQPPVEGLDDNLVYTIRTRAYTWHGREFYDPNFGMGLLNPEPETLDHIEASLNEIPDTTLITLTRRLDGRTISYRALLEILGINR